MQTPIIGSVPPGAQRPSPTSLDGADQARIEAKTQVVAETAETRETAAAAPDEQQVSKALDNINKAMQKLGQDLEFSVDPESNRTVIKVIDQRTNEIIRQMPSVEALEISKALDRVQGLLVRQVA